MSEFNNTAPKGEEIENEVEAFDANAQGEAFDAFAPENIGVVNFIQLGRIYDTLMAILQNLSPEDAEILLKTHFEGSLMGPSPRFNGNFVTDELNSEGV